MKKLSFLIFFILCMCLMLCSCSNATENIDNVSDKDVEYTNDESSIIDDILIESNDVDIPLAPAVRISGHYSGEYSEYEDCIFWQIDFNPDGNCLITYMEYERFSATYTVDTDGNISIDVPDLMCVWSAYFDGDVLMVKGTGISSGNTGTPLTKTESSGLPDTGVPFVLAGSTYAAEFNTNVNCIPWQITFSEEGKCVVLHNGYEKMPSTYVVYDSGEIVIDIPALWCSWSATIDGDVLTAKGTGLGIGCAMTKVQ